MKQKDFLIIIIFFFILVLVWIAEGIYHSAVNSTISEATSKDISPIAPKFDTKTINELREREKITPSYELEATVPTPTSLPIQIFSPQNSSMEGQLSL